MKNRFIEKIRVVQSVRCSCQPHIENMLKAATVRVQFSILSANKQLIGYLTFKSHVWSDRECIKRFRSLALATPSEGTKNFQIKNTDETSSSHQSQIAHVAVRSADHERNPGLPKDVGQGKQRLFGQVAGDHQRELLQLLNVIP